GAGTRAGDLQFDRVSPQTKKSARAVKAATAARAARGWLLQWRHGWRLKVLAAAGAVALVFFTISTYYYVTFSRMIDARLRGELMQRTDPRVFARPFELHRAQSFTPTLLIERLNDLGYTQRARAEQPGEFTIVREGVALVPR